MENYFEIGKIVNTQGVKGEVRVMPSTDDVTRFELLKNVKLYRKDEVKNLEIEKIRYHKQFVLVKFKGIDTMNDGQLLRDFVFRVSDEESIPLYEDEYFIRDLIDIKVFDTDNSLLGKLKDVLVTGANDVYVIKTEDKDILIPAIKECIISVDMEKKSMVVKLLKGLVD